MSLHLNDYEEKTEKKCFFGLKSKYCDAKLLKKWQIPLKDPGGSNPIDKHELD